jgi:DNA-binding transcriptional MerR regulator
MAEYRKTEIAKKLRMSPRKTQYWVDEKIVIPEIVPPSGRGRAMLFSEKNLIEFAMAQFLQAHEFTLVEISAALQILRGEVETDINLEDFYTNAEWGVKKDVVVIKPYPAFDPETNERSFTLFYVEKDEEGNYVNSDGETVLMGDLVEDSERGIDMFSVTVLLLGNLKNMAIEALL